MNSIKLTMTEITFDSNGKVLKKFYMKPLNLDGDLYEDNESYINNEVDENEEHRLCANELI